jgi:predicted RNA-binding protein YlqC (UPF0109 family)
VGELKTKLPYTSLVDYEREIGRLKQQLEKDNKSNKTKTAEIKSRITMLEKAKVQYQEYYEKWETYMNQQQRYQQLSESLDKTNLDLKNRLTKQADYTKSLQELKPQQDVEQDLQQLKKERDALREEYEQLKEARRKISEKYASPENQEVLERRKEIKNRMDLEKKKRSYLLDELEQYKRHIVVYKIKFNPETYPALIGRQGKNIKQIREQSKADINVSKEVNMIIIRGTKEAVDMAKQLIDPLLRESVHVRFKPDLLEKTSDIIGQLRRKCGPDVSLFLDKLGGTIKIQASNNAALSKAKTIVEKFVVEQNENETVHIPITDPLSMSVLLTRNGENLRLLRKTGVSRVNVNTNKKELELQGTKSTIEEAKQLFEKLVVCTQ